MQKRLFVFQRFGDRYILHHNFGVWHRLREFFPHELDCLGGLRILRQIVDHAVINAERIIMDILLVYNRQKPSVRQKTDTDSMACWIGKKL